MFLLDTNALSDLLKGHAKLVARLRAVPDGIPVVTSIVSRFEILTGRYASITKAANRAELLLAADRMAADELQLGRFVMLPVTEAVADQFDRLRTDKKLKLKKSGRDDVLIACIALANRATLVTRNTKDFTGIPGLKLENWAD